MMLFLILLIPIGLALILVNHSRDGHAVILPVMPFFQGMLLFLPSFVLSTIIFSMLEPSYTGAGLFFYTFFREHFVMLVLCFGWMILLRNSLLLKPKENILYNIMAFVGGYYTLINIHEYLSRITHLDAYALFLLPLVNLSLVVLGALLLARVVREFGLARFGALAALIALPFAMTLCTVFFLRNLLVPSIISTVILVASAGGFYFLRKEAVV
jgi:hypothetical protein